MSVSALLVRHARLPGQLQLALAADPRHIDALTANEHLSSEAFQKLYGKRLDAKLASSALRSARSSADVDHVIGVVGERRARPLIQLMESGVLRDAQYRAIAANRPPASFATKVVRSPDVRTDTQALFVAAASAAAASGWLEDNHTMLDPSNVADVLVNGLRYAYGRTRTTVLRRTRAIAWMNPGVLAALSDHIGTNVAVAITLAALDAGAEIHSACLDVAADVESGNWQLNTARAIAATVLDRNDLDPSLERRAENLASKLWQGTRPLADAGIGYQSPNSYRRAARTDGVSLRNVSDTELLDVICDRKAVATMNLPRPFDGLHPRAFSWADLALNPHLAPHHAEVVHRLVRAETSRSGQLGSAAGSTALRALKGTHRGVVDRLPPRVTNLRRRRTESSLGDPNAWSVQTETVARKQVGELSAATAPVAAEFLAGRFGDSEVAWQIAISLADDFSGTVRQLATTALNVAKM